MSCRVSEEQLWSWVDRQAPELEAHLAECPRCRALAAGFRAGIQAVAAGSPSPELRLPKRIGSYAITGLLGEGGQGIVYRAEQESPKRPVALKVLKGSRVRHFRQEIQSLARLNHSAIATIYEANETEFGQHFFAMELVDGAPLDEYVRAHGLALPQRLDLFCKVCAGVQYAHEHDVIHRDLKPSNILINAAGDPKILDFGLARLTNADVTLTLTATETGKIVGTLRYMSPEQARGDPTEIDARTDVYSLGVVLYELMTDRPPHEPSSLAIPQAMATICETPPRRPSAVNRALRGDLETIVLKALEKERSQRYQSVAELCQDVGRYLRGEPIRARPPSGLYVLRKKVSKHRLAFGVGAAILLLSAVGIVGTSWSNHRHRYDARHCILLNQRAIEVGSGEVYVANARTEFDQHPEIPEARLVYAQAMFATGMRNKNQRQCNDAATLLQEAQGIPGGWPAKLLLSNFRRTQGDTRAEREQAEGLRDAPDTDEGWYVRSFATLDTVEAQRCVTAALRRNARHLLATERLAHLAFQNRDFDGALAAIETLMRDFRYDRAEWTMFEVAALNQQGRYEEAMKLCAAVATLSPVGMSAYVQRGLARLCLRDYAGAAADYSHIIDQWGLREGRWVYYRRATAWWALRQWEKAAADCRVFRDLHGRGTYATVRLFLVLHEQATELDAQGHGAEADRPRTEAQEALGDGLHAAVPESWQANVLRCLGGALAPADLVAAANPRSPEEVCEGFYYAGERCLLDGDRAAARQWFERCRATNQMFDVDQWPLDPMNEYHLAIWRLDQFEAEDQAAGSSETQPAAAAADGG